MGVSDNGSDHGGRGCASLERAGHRQLTALLSGSGPTDACESAQRLLERWPSVADVLAESYDMLDRVAGPEVATRLMAIRELLVTITLDAIEDRPLLGTGDELAAYLQVVMAHVAVEEVRILFLTASNRLQRIEVMGTGSGDRCCFFPREIVRRALELRSGALILAHNHPGGGTSPSKADLSATRTLIELAGKFDIKVHDHVLVTRGRCRSLRALGLI